LYVVYYYKSVHQ